MRGLTPIERALLVDAATPADPAQDVAPPNEADVFEQLQVLGRVRVVAGANDEWTWHDWRTTDLGFLALRVCPVGES